MRRRTGDARHLDRPVRPRLAQPLVHLERARDVLPGLALGQERPEHRAVLACLRGALRNVRQGRVGGVAEEDDLVVDPARQGQVDPQGPLDELAFWCEAQALQRTDKVRTGVPHRERED